MQEPELTQLWYLAAAIAGAPTEWQQVLALAEQHLTSQSEALREAIEALRIALGKAQQHGSLDAKLLRGVADGLLKMNEGPAADAGRAVAWALDTVSDVFAA